MLAVLALFLFTTGSIRDFALALLVGMTSGVYSTIFIASAVVLFWENRREGRARKEPKASVAAGSDKAHAKP
jgi:preprotein translocase subunit SecF